MYRSARSLEASENYALARGALMPTVGVQGLPPESEVFVEDWRFWRHVFARPDSWDQTFLLRNVVLSQWVPRVPGLYWSEGATKLRRLGDSAIEYTSERWRVLQPLGKSQKVFGGVGTLKFPPDSRGRRLVSLCTGLNASAGIPALISPEVWWHHRLGEGRLLSDLWAKWVYMSEAGWAERFPSIKGIPKSYLAVERPEQVHRSKDNMPIPIQFHPCTVMEYSQGDAKLFDFVYATADTAKPNYRSLVESFFEEYKNAGGRYGRYLLSGDIGDPWWEAEFESPEALRRAVPGAKSQLELLQARVRRESFNGQNLDSIVQLLAGTYDNNGLNRISTLIGISPAHWYTGRAAADSAVELLQLCVERNKVEELLDAVASEYPESFMEGVTR
jgi:hypothetical protein